MALCERRKRSGTATASRCLATVALALFLAACGQTGTTAAAGGGNGAAFPPSSQNVQPLPDFSLVDQNGQAFRFLERPPKLSLVAFLYTHCTDVCPYSAIKMRQAWVSLGDKSAQVRLVAVTTDPERDTVPVVAAYSRALDMPASWTFLTGDPGKVAAVWKEFGVAVGRAEADSVAETAKNASELGMDLPAASPASAVAAGLSEAQAALAKKVGASFGGGYEVTHSSPFWIIDSRGAIQATLDADASPADLAKRLAELLQ